MQQETQFDLIVVGGGTAGAFSATPRAREGLKVAVVERGTCLGGLAASSGLTEMNAAGFQGAPLYRGIEREVFDRLIWGRTCGLPLRSPNVLQQRGEDRPASAMTRSGSSFCWSSWPWRRGSPCSMRRS